MNDEKKDIKPTSSPMMEAEENAWDDDDGGGRTLAMEGPSFELPSNVPSPITNPPPPVQVPKAAGAPPVTGAAAPVKPVQRISSPSMKAVVPPKEMGLPPPPGLRPGAPASDRFPAPKKTLGTQQMGLAQTALAPPPASARARAPAETPDESPTMAVASSELTPRPMPESSRLSKARPSPMASTGYVPDLSSPIDKDAETMAVAREDLFRGHRDAQLIVGGDAQGDENTLAVAPDALDGGIGAALAETLKNRAQYDGGPSLLTPQQQPAPQQITAQQQAFGMPPQSYAGNASNVMTGSSGHVPAAPPYGQAPGGLGMQQQPPSWGASPSAPTFGGPPGHPQQMMHQQHPQHVHHAQPWNMQPSPPPAGVRSRFTPQVIVLIAVGAVCLAIFIVGIVLFVTTKF